MTAAPALGVGGSDWFRRIGGVRPFLGAGLAGGLMWIPSHDVEEVITASMLFLVVLVGLQLADRWLTPVWALLATVLPRWLRMVIGIGLPVALAIGRFGPSAAGKEVATARSALLMATLVAHVFLRPRQADVDAHQAAQAARAGRGPGRTGSPPPAVPPGAPHG